MSELRNREKAVRECAADLRTRLEAAQDRLKSLRAELPMLLAGSFLGEITAAEVAAHKANAADLETFIADAALALDGLQTLASELRTALEVESRAERQTQAQARYKDLLAKVQALGDPSTYDRQLESVFRSAAHAVGKQRQASDLLRELEKRRDNRRPIVCQPVNGVVNHE